MEIDSLSKDLETKTMKYDINQINALIKKAGYIHEIYKPDSDDKKKENRFRYKIDKKIPIEEVISNVLKIKCVEVYWYSDDLITIKYKEK